MDLRTRFQLTLGLLLSISGTLCFGLGFGFLCVLIWLGILAFKNNFCWREIPERFSRPILTFLCFGYLPSLMFWGNFTYYTGFPRMTNEEAFWFFNLYTLLPELLLLCSQKSDHSRSFLILIAIEQLISGMIFRPTLFTIFLFLPTFALLLLTIHFRADFLQTKRSLQLEMKNTCEEMIRHFAMPISAQDRNVPSTFYEISARKTPVILGAVGEEEIRHRLSDYPIQVKRRRQSLCFFPEIETLERVRVWDDWVSTQEKTAENPRHVFWRWAKKSVFWTLGALIFGLLFFVTIYRPEHFRAGNFGWGMPASIGYSETVRLGEFGPQLKNPKPFFKLRLFRDDGSREWNILVKKTDFASETDFETEPIYLRGATFDVYKNSTWENSPEMLAVNPTATRGHEYSPQLIFRSKFLNFPGLIRLEETFEPTTEQTFFSTGPCYLLPSPTEGPTEFSIKKDKYQFENEKPVAGVPYSVLSHGFLLTQNGISQSEWTPCLKPERNFAYVQEPDEERFPALRELARKWTEKIKKTSEIQNFGVTSYRKFATEMAWKLAHSPDFSYSVNPVRRERGLDPVEDFVRNHPEGHCEFYATALVLMLRSQGIPARYVVGFVTQEYSPTLGAWVIRHQDAHAWVEAWIPPEEIPDEVRFASGIPHTHWHFGAWLRLDPTSQQVRVATQKKLSFPFRLADRWEAVWKNYYLNMNFQAQHEWIYDPITEFLSKMRDFYQEAEKRRTFSVLFAVIGIFLLFFCVAWGVYRRWNIDLAQGKYGKKRSRFQHSVHDARKYRTENGNVSETDSSWAILTTLQKRRAHSVTFYQRLEKELATRGLTRKNGETSLEFMTDAEEKLGLHGWTEMTRKYYAIRFGNDNEK